MSKMLVVYWSGTGNTEKMAYEVAEGAKHYSDVELKVLQVGDATKQDVIDADKVALGCPSMGAEVLEEDEMEPFVESLSDIDWANKSLALFGSYDWGDGEWMRNWQEQMEEYGASIVDQGLIVHLEPEEDDCQKCRELGGKLAG